MKGTDRIRPVTPTISALIVLSIGCPRQNPNSVSPEDEWLRLRTRPELGFALVNRCPVPGLPRSALRSTLGDPNRKGVQPPLGDEWVYSLGRDSATLSVLFQHDTVVSWSAQLNPREWRPCRTDQKHATRVLEYLSSLTSPAPSLAYAMHSRCLVTAMSAREVMVSQGVPSYVDSSMVPRVRWTYLLSTEGGKLVVEFVDDALVAWKVEGKRGTERTENDLR